MSGYRGLIHLAGLLVVLPWLVYTMAIGGTVGLGRELKHAEKELAALHGQHDSVPAVAVVADEPVLPSGGVIALIMDCEAGDKCSAVRYTPYVTESRDALTVHTAELVLSGGYADLVRLIRRTERVCPCRLVSVEFRSVKQRQRKETQLHATIILQQITGAI